MCSLRDKQSVQLREFGPDCSASNRNICAIPHLILLVRHRWREFLVGAAIGTLLIVGMFLWIGFEASAQYFQLARRMVTAR